MTTPDITFQFVIYTDGSCPRNGIEPGKAGGGWASICLVDGHPADQYTVYGSDPATTNNRMEMLAVINGLNALPDDSTVDVYSDSQYVVYGITEWIKHWIANNWPRRVKNADLWVAMLEAQKRHRIVRWNYLKGHSGNEWNEMADALAGAQAGQEIV